MGYVHTQNVIIIIKPVNTRHYTKQYTHNSANNIKKYI